MVNEPYSTSPPPNVRIRLQLVARPSRGRNRKVLFTQEIDGIELNEPIRLDIPAGFEIPYNTPLSVTMQVLRGDASGLKDGILTLRFQPRRTRDAT